MARQFGNLDDILSAVVARIISQISGFNSANCYLSINPDALPVPSPGEITCVVAPSSGEFDQGMLDGGGLQQCNSNSGVIVKLHSPVQLDDVHRDTQFLTHESLGIVEKMRQILKILTDWSPQNDASDYLSRDPLLPASYTFTRDNRSLGAVEVVFHLSHDWNLA